MAVFIDWLVFRQTNLATKKGIKYSMEEFMKYLIINTVVTRSEGLQISMHAGVVSYYSRG